MSEAISAAPASEPSPALKIAPVAARDANFAAFPWNDISRNTALEAADLLIRSGLFDPTRVFIDGVIVRHGLRVVVVVVMGEPFTSAEQIMLPVVVNTPEGPVRVFYETLAEYRLRNKTIQTVKRSGWWKKLREALRWVPSIASVHPELAARRRAANAALASGPAPDPEASIMSPPPSSPAHVEQAGGVV